MGVGKILENGSWVQIYPLRGEEKRRRVWGFWGFGVTTTYRCLRYSAE